MVKQCPKCGTNITYKESRFCNKCGAALPSAGFYEKLRNDWSFSYSSLFHAVIAFDILFCISFGYVFLSSFFIDNVNQNEFYHDPVAFLWFVPLLASNLILDVIFLLNERKNPHIIDSRLCWIKCIVAFLGVFTLFSGLYFAIITTNMFFDQRQRKRAEHLENERIRKEKRREKERWEKIKNTIRKLDETGDIRYLENFAKIYRHSTKISSEFEKLKNLLETKQIQLDPEELESVIEYCRYFWKNSEFKNKIFHNNPKNSDDCIRNYLDLFSNSENPWYPFALEDILIENFQYRGDILSDIDRVKKGIELKKFEENLFSELPSDEIISIVDIDHMSGYDFELFLKQLFEKMGYKVIHTMLSNDQGADLIIEKFGERTVIQAKNWQNNVGNTGIQEIVAAIKHYHAQKAMVISSSGFTPSACDLAKSNGVELWDRQKLVYFLKNYPMFKPQK
jgi:hypothetical protein